jgi:hypothetical protein
MAGYTLTLDFDDSEDALVASVQDDSRVLDSVAVGDSLDTEQLREAWYDIHVDGRQSDYNIVTTYDQSIPAVAVHVFNTSTAESGAIAQAHVGGDLNSDKLYDSWVKFHEKDNAGRIPR